MTRMTGSASVRVEQASSATPEAVYGLRCVMGEARSA